MRNRDFLSLFKNRKPVIGMLHLKGDDNEDVFERFKKELSVYEECGIDGVIVEDYFGDYTDLERALSYIHKRGTELVYGVNCLNVDPMGFYLARKYDCAFLQRDSVVGHVKPRDEATIQAYLELERQSYDGCVLGGVRFKYQPMLSVNSLEHDLIVAKNRCDGICVTQDATGQETSMDKIISFRETIGDFPLIVAAGVTADNIEKQMRYVDAAIIGSYFKDNYKDEGDVCREHVQKILDVMKKIRSGS